MEVQALLSDFRKKLLPTKKYIQRQVKNVMASLCCHGNSDVNKTWIITDFHLYTEQLW